MSSNDDAVRNEEAEERRRAVAALPQGEVDGRNAKLITALGDVDWRVRKEAARVAAENADGWGLLPALVDALCQGENVGLRNSALEVLERLGPRASSALLVALPRVPETARKFIVAALGFAGGAGVEKLAEISNDVDTNTAQAAVEALARVGGARAEEALRQHLRSQDPVLRLAALEGLERLEARLGIDHLAPLLEDRLVRRLALRLLGFSDDPAAVAPLFGAMSEANAAVTSEAAIALGKMLERGGPVAREAGRRARAIDPETRRTLRSLASHGRDRAQRAATWLLLLAQDREVLATAAELAADDRLPPVALEAVRAWGSSAATPLLSVASTLTPRARAAALEMATELASSDPGASASVRTTLTSALREALEDRDPIVAGAACAAMGTWAEAQDAQALVRCAARFPEQTARHAGRALERLALRHRQEVDDALGSVTLDGTLGAALLPAVAALGGPSATDRLQGALSANDPRARRAAVMALPRVGADRAVELAGFALADEDVDVQVAAVMVLAQLADDKGNALGATHLRLALRANFEPVIAAAARALGSINDRTSITPLRELVSEGRPGVAVAAMEALRALGDPTLDDLLVEALGQADEELVKEALRAIAQSQAPRRASRIALALEHPAWDVRQLAARLLGDEQAEGAPTALRKRLEREGDTGVRAAIEDSLTRLDTDR